MSSTFYSSLNSSYWDDADLTSETYHSDFLKGLKYFKNPVAGTVLKLVYGGNLHQESDGVKIINLQNIESKFYNDSVNVFANRKV